MILTSPVKIAARCGSSQSTEKHRAAEEEGGGGEEAEEEKVEQLRRGAYKQDYIF